MGRGNRECHRLTEGSKRAIDPIRHVDPALRAAPGNQRWVDLGQDLVQGQRHQDLITVILGRKGIGNRLPQLPKRNLNNPFGELGQDGIDRHADRLRTHIELPYPGLKFQGQ
jgi:hypothetical protein